MIQHPKDEREMVRLKNYIAETELNLAKISNEVARVYDCLMIFEAM